ncbi:MAG TPA: PQQ-binding-like beta-propeller repeat protein, partial [Rhizomicrobium sp.]|nr:PQQ-binding-like beta-propeller repeat protein [Rhizomicrobium sp.]
MKRILTSSVLGAPLLGAALLGASAIALEPGPFTTEQSRTGRALYAANCAACHGSELKGAGEAPALAGGTFIAAWGNRSTDELYNLVKASMPYGNGNSLDADTYRKIVAYVLAANGAQPGIKSFSGGENIKIASIADGKTPVAVAEAEPVRGGDAPRPATSYPATRFGLTVAGALKSYTPVTDAMLAHPKDADWLMYRRNYQGWSHSPLSQVNSANVKGLQLQWSWAMNDGGAAQVTPIVHDGIMFLSNTANTVQALDAKTGELIWENRIGPAPTRAYGATRSLALYGDKVLVPTTDAKLYGLDAKTGKIVW